MPRGSVMQFSPDEIVMIISGLEILSPDSEEGEDLRGDLEARFRAMHEDGANELALSMPEIELMIAGTEILSPDEDEDAIVRDEVCERLRVAHAILAEEGPTP